MQHKKTVLTGDRPTGRLHLGHYVGSLKARLQKEHEQFIMVADIQALTDHWHNPEKVVQNVLEVIIDYLAVGIDPSTSCIFVQSQVPELAELTLYYMNFVTLGRLQRNPTVKNEIQQKGYDESLPIGFLCYPISQAADITGFGADLVPVGDDQLPIIEQTNEIVRAFNRTYNTNCLKEVQAVLSHCPRLPGIDGKGKASKSLGNAILLSDPPDVIKQKVHSMYTDPTHLKASDKGRVEGNVVFSYLDAFCDDKTLIEGLKEQYRNGGLGDMVLKNLLNEVLQSFLAPIRAKRKELESDIIAIKRLVIGENLRIARARAEDTLRKVKAEMGILY